MMWTPWSGWCSPIPEAALRTEGPAVTRLAVPPVQLNGFVKRATMWEDVQAVSLLRTHAPRLVATNPRLAARILREADPDIGVARATADAVHIERTPGRRWLKPSWQRWLIAELAFGALLDSRLPEDLKPSR